MFDISFKQEKEIFKSKENTNKTTPVATRAEWASPCNSIAPAAIFVVKVLTLWNNEFGISALPPIIIATAIVSPIALPIAKTIPAKIPLLAAGTRILNVACSFVAPNAKAPSK